ncbi:MAG: hypothetical protein GXP63_05475 [DPANN group archaeon]|nr:hypothetical protein [DPANN group archaeon]
MDNTQSFFKNLDQYIRRLQITLGYNRGERSTVEERMAKMGIEPAADHPEALRYHNCFNHVLGKEGPDLIKGVDALVESLTVSEDVKPGKGGVVWYFIQVKHYDSEQHYHDLLLSHAGYVQEDGLVISKWGENRDGLTTPIFRHRLWDVPLGAGNLVYFSEIPPKEHIDQFVEKAMGRDTSLKEMTKKERASHRLYMNSANLHIS